MSEIDFTSIEHEVPLFDLHDELNYDPEKRGGGVSWAVLGSVALALEFRKETLSNAAARLRESHPLGRAAVLGLGIYFTGHLMDWWKHDPLDWSAQKLQINADFP